MPSEKFLLNCTEENIYDKEYIVPVNSSSETFRRHGILSP